MNDTCLEFTNTVFYRENILRTFILEQPNLVYSSSTIVAHYLVVFAHYLVKIVDVTRVYT